MTVSRAFRRDTSVDQKTREKILRIAEEMGYVLDSTASTLRSQKTGFVAVTIPSLNNANFADTVRGLDTELQAHGLQTLLGYTDYNVLEEERLIIQLLQRRPEAIVVTGGRHTERARRLLANAGIPVVEIWDLPSDPIGHVVGFSNAEAISQMVEHLHSAGAQRLAFIGGDDKGDTRGADRRLGFEETARALGLSYTLHALGPPPVSMREGSIAMGAILDAAEKTDAVLCVSDLAAFGALSECQRRNVRVPGDIMIAGFGAFDISALAVPTLSTVDAHSTEIGQKAGALLVSLLRESDSAEQPVSITRIQPTLKVSGSTAPRS